MPSGWALISSFLRALPVLLAAKNPSKKPDTLLFFLLRLFIVAQVSPMLTLGLGSALALGSQLVLLLLGRWYYLFRGVV